MTANQILTALRGIDKSLLDECKPIPTRCAAARKRIYAACIVLAAVSLAVAIERRKKGRTPARASGC